MSDQVGTAPGTTSRGEAFEAQSQRVLDELRNRFMSHDVSEPAKAAMTAIRDAAHTAAKYITEKVPRGREQALALTKIEEVVFWANAGIARAFPAAIGEATEP